MYSSRKHLLLASLDRICESTDICLVTWKSCLLHFLIAFYWCTWDANWYHIQMTHQWYWQKSKTALGESYKIPRILALTDILSPSQITKTRCWEPWGPYHKMLKEEDFNDWPGIPGYMKSGGWCKQLLHVFFPPDFKLQERKPPEGPYIKRGIFQKQWNNVFFFVFSNHFVRGKTRNLFRF